MFAWELYELSLSNYSLRSSFTPDLLSVTSMLTPGFRSSLQDNGNIGAGNLTPLGLFFVIFGIGACFGWETGYAINLARDFGPRLMSFCLGYGHHVWQAGGHYFWVMCSLILEVAKANKN
jgi:glycerol uptake facilitator-like aquaporin